MARIDKFPNIMDISDPKNGAEVPCGHCGKSMLRYQHTLDRMVAIDGFISCSNSCRQAKKAVPDATGIPCE